MDLLLRDLLSNQSAVFDVVSLLGIAGLVLFIYNIRFGNRILSFISAGMIFVCLAASGGIWILESHYQQRAASQSIAGWSY